MITLSAVERIPTALRIVLLELIPFPLLYRLLIRRFQIILVYNFPWLLSTAFNHPSSPLLLLKILIDSHRRQTVSRPKHPVPELLSLVHQHEWLQRLAGFAQQWAILTSAVEEGS